LATGTLLAIDSAIDPTTGTVKIKALFDNKNDELFPAQFVNARMLINNRSQRRAGAHGRHSAQPHLHVCVRGDPRPQRSRGGNRKHHQTRQKIRCRWP